MTYTAPLADMRFALREVAGLAHVSTLPGYEHATAAVHGNSSPEKVRFEPSLGSIRQVLDDPRISGHKNTAVVIQRQRRRLDFTPGLAMEPFPEQGTVTTTLPALSTASAWPNSWFTTVPL